MKVVKIMTIKNPTAPAHTQKIQESEQVNKIVITGLMAALCYVALPS